MCECNCDCEIDTSRPEDYEVIGDTWRQITNIYKKAKDRSGFPYVVAFQDSDGYELSISVDSESIRRKPKWQPEVGKWYMFSDKKEDIGTARGHIRKFMRIEPTQLPYIVENLYSCGESWKHCWPACGLIELGE